MAVALQNGSELPHIEARVYRGFPRLAYYIREPLRRDTTAPLLVAIHGISRTAREQVELLAPIADRHGAILVAPHFSKDRYADYQRMGRMGRGLRADLALDNLIDQLESQFDISPGHTVLSGFSGGAQFAHRYAMTRPERVMGLVVSGAGWYTFPDREQRYPYGLRPSRQLPGITFRPEDFLRVPTLAIAGDRDIDRNATLRISTRSESQGRNRVERAVNWVSAMETMAREMGIAPVIAVEILKGPNHHFRDYVEGGLDEKLSDFMLRLSRQSQSETGSAQTRDADPEGSAIGN